MEQKAEREALVTKMATRMEENKAKAAADAAKGDSKEEGGLLNSLKGMFNIDQKNRAGAHIEQKNAQVSAFKGIPGAVSGGMKSGMPALKEGVKEGRQAERISRREERISSKEGRISRKEGRKGYQGRISRKEGKISR